MSNAKEINDNALLQCPVIHSSPLPRNSNINIQQQQPLIIPQNHPPIYVTSIKFLGAKLQPGVSKLNMISYMLAVFMSIMYFVYVNASTGFLLSDVIHLPKSILGRAAGNLSFADELFSMLAILFWGIASDVIGRRNVYVMGFFLMGIGLFLYPLMKHLLPEMFIARLLFAWGASSSSCMLTAVLADYGTDADRGKLAGLVGMASGLGAVTGALVLLRLPGMIAAEWFDSPNNSTPGLILVYQCLAILSVVFGFFLFFGMRKNPAACHVISSRNSDSEPLLRQYTRQQQLPATSFWFSLLQDCPVAIREYRSIFEIARDGLAAGKDSSILLGYIGSFLARGDSIIITIFLSLWVNKYFEMNGLCPDFDPNNPKGTCRQAYILASSLSGIAQMCALIGAPLIGYLLDRVYEPILTLFSFFICGLGYLFLSLVLNPTSPLLYPIVMVIGFGEITVILISLSLTTGSNVPKQSRGAVAGFSSFWGAIGILVTTQAGGWLFDTWNETGPFLLMAAAHTIAFSFAIKNLIVRIKKDRGS